VDEFRDLAELSRSTRAGIAWWRRRSRAQRVLMFAGLVVLAGVVSPTVRGALVGLVVAAFGLVLLVALVSALTVGLLGRIVRRHPLADLAVGYLIGRRHARRYVGQYGPGYPPPSSKYSPPPGYPPSSSYYYPPPPPSWAPPTPPAGTSWALPAAHVRGNRCVTHGRRADG
jgi:hypothetical protein